MCRCTRTGDDGITESLPIIILSVVLGIVRGLERKSRATSIPAKTGSERLRNPVGIAAQNVDSMSITG